MHNFKPSPDYSVVPETASSRRVVLLHPDGTECDLAPEEITPDNLRLLLDAPYFEYVSVMNTLGPHGETESVLLVDEEGLLKNLPRNNAATQLYQRDVRAMYPGEKDAFLLHDAHIRNAAKERGMTYVSVESPGLDPADPHIAGVAIWFVSRNSYEVDELIDGLEEPDEDA